MCIDSGVILSHPKQSQNLKIIYPPFGLLTLAPHLVHSASELHALTITLNNTTKVSFEMTEDSFRNHFHFIIICVYACFILAFGHIARVVSYSKIIIID